MSLRGLEALDEPDVFGGDMHALSRTRHRHASSVHRTTQQIHGNQSNAAPTMIFRISVHGLPCEIEFVCVGWPFASPPVPCFWYSPGPVTASRLPQKSVVIAL